MEEKNKGTNSSEEKKILYKTRGTCSQYIEIAIKNNAISKCIFHGGCAGNTKGISQLVLGMNPQDVIQKLNGICCGGKPTSCPDQLCRALEEIEKTK